MSFKKFSKPVTRPRLSVDQKTIAGTVRKAFDLSALRRVCGTEQLDFPNRYPDLQTFAVSGNRSAQVVEARKPGLDESFYHFADRGARILAVAHLDTVQEARFCAIDRGTVYSPVLDDRLGAYTILEMLPALGITVDVLLTTDEECGASTAADFYPALHGIEPDRYNWILEFDRAGTDCVLYHFDGNEDFNCALEDHNWEIGWGSFSDIAALSLGCCAVNFGVGYADYHSIGSHVRLRDYFDNVARAVSFYHEFHAQAFVYMDSYQNPKNTSSLYSRSYDSPGGYDDKFDDDYLRWFNTKDDVSLAQKTPVGDEIKANLSDNYLDLVDKIALEDGTDKLFDEIDAVFGSHADAIMNEWFDRQEDDLTSEGHAPGDWEFSRKQIRLLWERDYWADAPENESVGTLRPADWAYISWLEIEKIGKANQQGAREQNGNHADSEPYTIHEVTL